jgi:hypothetical protein
MFTKFLFGCRGSIGVSRLMSFFCHHLLTLLSEPFSYPVGEPLQTGVALSQTRRVGDYQARIKLRRVRSIMRLHQGSWEVDSEQGVNRFTLRFPG